MTTTVKLTNLTFQQIADEAQTSRTVLYRRWATTFDLLQDVYSYKAKKLFEGEFFDELKDNGSLRKDLLQLLTVYQNIHTEIGAEIINNYYFLRAQDTENDREFPIHKKAVEKYMNTTKSILTAAEKEERRSKRQTQSP